MNNENWSKISDDISEVKKKIKLCLKNKKLPIIVGGTGLYFNTITKGMSKIPDIDSKTRAKVRNLFNKIGYKKFYEKLKLYKNLGFTKPRFKHYIQGYNFRMTGMQASIANSQLSYVNEIINKPGRSARVCH